MLKTKTVFLAMAAILAFCASFLYGAVKTTEFLKQKNMIKFEYAPGESPYLGRILNKYLPKDVRVSLPEAAVLPIHIRTERTERDRALKRFFGLNGLDIALFAFPVKIVMKDYKCFLNKRIFALFKNASTLVGRSRNYNYYILKGSSPEVGLYIYKNNIVIAPLMPDR